jgi:hypothetical protein
MSIEPKIHSFADGELKFWIEQKASIHIKTSEPYGDPVELTPDEAKSIALALLESVRQIEAEDSNWRTA